MNSTATVQSPDDSVDSPLMRFIDAWNDAALPFPAWVIGVARAFVDSRLKLEAAARRARTSPGELQGVLALATMDESDLAKLGRHIPKTTWFLFSEATSEGVDAGVRALRTIKRGHSPAQVVEDAMKSSEGPDRLERVATLSEKAFGHMARKAKQYDQLRPKDRSALVEFAKRRRGGRPLTPKQSAYASDLLSTLRDAGVVRRDSPDKDQVVCNEILDAIGG